jgi:hypothetical protein
LGEAARLTRLARELVIPAMSGVIVGATSQEEVFAIVRAASWLPSKDDLAELNRITRGRCVVRRGLRWSGGRA